MHPYSRFTGTVYFDDLDVRVIGTTTAVKDLKGNDVPKTYELSNNYPNPFNPSTSIKFAVPTTGNVSIFVYNVLGQKIRMLADGVVSSGYHELTWDGRDDLGVTVQSGVYFYRMQAGSMAIVKKMLLVK